MTESNVRSMWPVIPMSALTMGQWFLRLGSRILKHRLRMPSDRADAFDPTGFLLVLINDGQVRVWHGGLSTWTRFEEAADAGVHQYQHEYDQAREWSYHRTPQEHREWVWKRDALQSVQAEAYEAKHPYICPDNPAHRFETKQGLAIHQRSCRTKRDRAEWEAYRTRHPEQYPDEVWEKPALVQ